MTVSPVSAPGSSPPLEKAQRARTVTTRTIAIAASAIQARRRFCIGVEVSGKRAGPTSVRFGQSNRHDSTFVMVDSPELDRSV